MRRLLSLLSLAALAAAGWRFRSWLCSWLGCDTELIALDAPGASSSITSPVLVSGWGRATQHNQLSVEIRDASNVVIGSGTAAVVGVLGQRGPFSATVSFAPAASGSPGHIQVFDSSPATGATTHLASVMIRFA